jgi:oxygen-dependent protoporphyrinogen oxidase
MPRDGRGLELWSGIVSDSLSVVVVGGGISGLAAAQRLADRLGGGRVALLEREGRLGGKILTELVDGYVMEAGPDCFLASKPAGLALCRALGLESRLLGTRPEHRRSLVKRGGRLYQLPDGFTGLVPSRLAPLLSTPLLSVRARLRAGLELVVPRRRGSGEESIREFASRRFGAEAYRWLIEPLLSGIYAGDGAKLSMDATFPQLVELERRNGSLLRAMLSARVRRSGLGQDGNGGLPAGFVTLAGGLVEIVETLEAKLALVRVMKGCGVRSVQRDGDGFWISLEEGKGMRARAVVLATPAFASARILADLDPRAAALLDETPFVSVATVSVALPAEGVPPLDGYGYLSPGAEGGPLVACTWTSSKFRGRAPRGGVLIRFFLGREGSQEAALASEAEVLALVREELRATLGITAEPTLWRVRRWPRGMPQYTLGHVERLAEIERRLARQPGLYLAGASYRGVGIPDCIASGWSAAEAAAAWLRGLG